MRTIQRNAPAGLSYFHAEIKSLVEENDRRRIAGYASTEDLDRGNEITHREAFQKSLRDYMRNPVLCYMHQWERVIGSVLSARIDDRGLYVEAEISSVETEIWTKIVEGSLRAFSFGFKPIRWEDETGDDGKTIRHLLEVDLFEISVVSIPMNRHALFNVQKSVLHGTDVECGNGLCLSPADYLKEQARIANLPQPPRPPSNPLQAGGFWAGLSTSMAALFDPDGGTGGGAALLSERYGHLSALYRQCGKIPPDLRAAASDVDPDRKERWTADRTASWEKESGTLRLTGQAAKEEALAAGLPVTPVFFHGENKRNGCRPLPPYRKRSRGTGGTVRELAPLLESLCRAVLTQQKSLLKIARALDPFVAKKPNAGR